MTRKPFTREAEISLEIRKALEKLGIPCYRMNSGGYRGRMRGHAKGTPDILALPQIVRVPTPYWIEVKRPGGKLRPEQLEFADRARNRGEFWCLAESVDDVLRELKNLGAR